MITKEQFASMQDHSVLGPGIKEADVRKFCAEVLEYGFAAVYVNPCDVKLAKSLIGDKANVGTVIGFPQGVNTTATKIFEALETMDNGADELDIVINIPKMRDNDVDYVRDELTQFVKAVKAKKADVVVKVIIEAFYLTHDQKVAACEATVASGADYVKQSSGTPPLSFTLGDVRLMKAVVGDRIKVKAAGWINNLEDAIGSIELGADRIGNSIAPEWLKEFDKQLWYTK
jgi:deoxyribose-phosphate aldolase